MVAVTGLAASSLLFVVRGKMAGTPESTKHAFVDSDPPA